MTWTTRPRCELAAGLSGFSVGSGPDLVLIHGVGLRAEAWNAMLPHLAAKFTVHAVDLPAHGQSRKVDQQSLTAYADRFAQLLDTMAGPVFLAGHSMGAMIALDLASRRLANLVAVAALNAIYRRSADAKAAVRNRAAQLGASTAPDPTPTLRRWFGDNLNTETAQACRSWLTSCDPAGYAMAYAAFSEADAPSDQALSELPIPALFMTGADEPNSTPEMSRAMAALCPRGRAEVVTDAAHMAPMTHAADMAGRMISFYQTEVTG